MELLQYTDAASNRPVLPLTERLDVPDGISQLVVALCYEHHLQMHGMLAVFAEHRGDDPDDALGSPDCRG